jgi:hypothetical protein
MLNSWASRNSGTISFSSPRRTCVRARGPARAWFVRAVRARAALVHVRARVRYRRNVPAEERVHVHRRVRARDRPHFVGGAVGDGRGRAGGALELEERPAPLARSRIDPCGARRLRVGASRAWYAAARCVATCWAVLQRGAL